MPIHITKCHDIPVLPGLDGDHGPLVAEADGADSQSLIGGAGLVILGCQLAEIAPDRSVVPASAPLEVSRNCRRLEDLWVIAISLGTIVPVAGRVPPVILACR